MHRLCDGARPKSRNGECPVAIVVLEWWLPRALGMRANPPETVRLLSRQPSINPFPSLCIALLHFHLLIRVLLLSSLILDSRRDDGLIEVEHIASLRCCRHPARHRRCSPFHSRPLLLVPFLPTPSNPIQSHLLHHHGRSGLYWTVSSSPTKYHHRESLFASCTIQGAQVRRHRHRCRRHLRGRTLVVHTKFQRVLPTPTRGLWSDIRLRR
jgi:hypothetical protein